MNPINYSHHEGISCDHCMKSNFRGKRYKCLVCPDYDLCSSCYESGTVPAGKRHTSEHPVQCILTRNDYEIYFGGEPNPIDQIQSFTCPICGKMGFTENLLYEHSVQEHSDTVAEVTCPICCSTQNIEPVVTIEDLTSHLSIEHRSGRGYDTPQTSSRGRRVPHTNRTSSGITQTRNRRQLTPATVTMLSNINPLLSSLPPHDQSSSGINSQIRDLDPITELLSQLRRSQNANQSSLSSNSFNNANSNALHLHLDRNSFRGNTLRQVFERPADIVVRRHNQSSNSNQPASQTTNLSSNAASALSYLLMENSNHQLASGFGQTVPNNSTNQGNQPSSNPFLLSTCKEKPKISKELEDAQKMDKSLFIQELLISSIENFFKYDLKFYKDDRMENQQQLSSHDQSNKKSENSENDQISNKEDKKEEVLSDRKSGLEIEQIKDDGNDLSVDLKNIENKELTKVNQINNASTKNQEINETKNELKNGLINDSSHQTTNQTESHFTNEISDQSNNNQIIIKNGNSSQIEQLQTESNDEVLASANTAISISTNSPNNDTELRSQNHQCSSSTNS